MIREYKESDYKMLCGWWLMQDWQPPHKELLPETGFVCNESAAGFLYTTNSSVFWLEWVVSNPECDKFLRNESIDDLIRFVGEETKRLGAKVLFTTTNKSSYEERLKRLGFVVGDTNTAQLFMGV